MVNHIRKTSSVHRILSLVLGFTTRQYSNRNVLKLHERGMYQDIFPDNASNEMIKLLTSNPQSVYAGFDPTADSLHIGNLLVIINLLHWQRAGHNVFALIGGATGLIGDPSGQTKDRPIFEDDVINSNVDSIRRNIETIFQNHNNLIWSVQENRKQDLSPLRVVNNLDWYKNIDALTFIGKIGRSFRMGKMLSRESVRSRIDSEAGMSFTEFTYQIFQAYDWWYLLEKFNCKFQIGGSDQMGNINAGHDLISRTLNKKVYGLTLPILTTETGNKYGKSEGNAIWLDKNKSSPFELYQFFVRSRDSEVEKLLKLFTFDSLKYIDVVMAQHKEKPEERIAQKRLAEQVTRLVHGDSGIEEALKTSAAIYREDLETLSKMSVQEALSLFKGAKLCELLFEPGLTVLNLAMKAGCFTKDRDAVRIISAGGFYINYQRSSNIEEVVSKGIHILPNNLTLLRTGKKTYCIVKWFQ